MTQRLRREISRTSTDIARDAGDQSTGAERWSPGDGPNRLQPAAANPGQGRPLHAHRFRHTFATGVRAGGEMERLRRILGRTTYVMVMRYVHLGKGDLGKDFDERSSF
jgi:integrase